MGNGYDAKIAEYDIVIGLQQHVFRLDIAMNKILIMGIL